MEDKIHKRVEKMRDMPGRSFEVVAEYQEKDQKREKKLAVVAARIGRGDDFLSVAVLQRTRDLRQRV